MSTVPPPRAAGILPDEVIRDTRANGYLFFLTLNPSLDSAGLQAWLQAVTAEISALEAPPSIGGVASVVVGFGSTFFQSQGQARFGLGSGPAGFASLPTIPSVADPADAARDVVFYIMSTSEAAVATFVRSIVAAQPGAVVGASVQRGYQRADGREHFGFLDGLRNVAPERRDEVIFLDRDNQPDEPDWADGGSYMAYMKLHQDLDAAARLGDAQLEQIMGRRKADGSRLDLPPDTDPKTEGFFGDPNNPPPASHIRKTGPRSAVHDLTEIFRRGIPYLELRPDGSVDGGLHFVSFQCSLDNFAVMLERWMNNPNFPTNTAGLDALFANNLVSIEMAGFYFVPPADRRFIGAGFFDAPRPDPCSIGRIIVRKQVVDQNNQPVLVDLGAFQFQVVDGNNQVLSTFQTDSAGHAVSGDLPRNQPLTLEEINPPAGFQPAPNQSLTLTQPRQIVPVINRVQGPAPPYNP